MEEWGAPLRGNGEKTWCLFQAFSDALASFDLFFPVDEVVQRAKSHLRNSPVLHFILDGTDIDTFINAVDSEPCGKEWCVVLSDLLCVSIQVAWGGSLFDFPATNSDTPTVRLSLADGHYTAHTQSRGGGLPA